MCQMTAPPPLQLIVGARGHGVVGYAEDVAWALKILDERTAVASVTDVADAIRHVKSAVRTHMHVTDGLLGRSPEEAALNLELIGAQTHLTITVHDVPQTSDGTVLPRRVAALHALLRGCPGGGGEQSARTAPGRRIPARGGAAARHPARVAGGCRAGRCGT